MWSNYHSHSRYCDGKGILADYLAKAREAGMPSVGFSSHAPLPFPCKWSMPAQKLAAYLREIASLQESARGIEVYKGLEIDFIPGVRSPLDFVSALDYTIGSIHFVDRFEDTRWEIDNTTEVFRKGLEKIFGNDVRAAVSRYYELIREMVSTTPPHIVGHLDKIKMHNQDPAGPFFDESEAWYRAEVEKTLEVIRRANVIVEVNTRGLYRKKTANPYPSPWILERLCEWRIPITLSSDAHHPDELTAEFEPMAAQLREIGFRKLSILRGGIWTQIPFTEYGLQL